MRSHVLCLGYKKSLGLRVIQPGGTNDPSKSPTFGRASKGIDYMSSFKAVLCTYENSIWFVNEEVDPIRGLACQIQYVVQSAK